MVREILAGGITFVVLQILVLLQYKLAEWDHFRTVEQMQRGGTKQGLPIEYHYGISGDWYYLSLLIAVIVALYWATWSWQDISKVLGLAVLITAVLSIVWLLPETPEAHVQNHRPTLAGIVHGIYMIPVVMALLLLYFFTPQPNPTLLIVVGVVLVVHIFIGQHMLLGLMKAGNGAEYAWYPDQPLKNWLGWFFLVALATALYWRVNTLLPTS